MTHLRLPLRFARGPQLLVEESLQPSEGIYLGEDYSGANKIVLRAVVEPDKDGKNHEKRVLMEIPATGSYPSAWISMGRINDRNDYFRDEEIQNAAKALHDCAERATILHVLRLASFWLSDQAEEEKLLGWERGSFRNLLILYRLAEICLAAIDRLEKELDPVEVQFQAPAALLVRQRYLYLAQLPCLAEEAGEKLSEFVSGYRGLIRRARQAYARLLIEQEDQLSLAFAETRNLPDSWSLDCEATLLIYVFKREEEKPAHVRITGQIWPFAQEVLADHFLTDTLLRKWFLAHDNVAGAAECVKAFYQEQKGWQRRAACILENTYWWGGTGLLLFFAGMAATSLPPNLSALAQPILLVLGVLTGVAVPLASLVTIFRSKRPLSSRQSLYPLALRVPAMGLVGVVAIAGLVDAFVRFTLNGLERFWYAIFIIAACWIAAFAYIFFEVQTRTPAPSQAGRRALRLWSCGLISTTWLAILTGWLVDPVGLTRCAAEEQAVRGACELLPPYGQVLAMMRSVLFLGARISVDYILLVGAIALLVGVFTQIFWEDRAIAEPL